MPEAQAGSADLDRINVEPTAQHSLEVRGTELEWGARTYVMAILNLTPNSFSGDGLASATDPVAAAIEAAELALEGGADILDVGGESTRPGSESVAAEDEIARVLPSIEGIRRRFPMAVISIDTSKALVAAAALDAGADIVNDVWALRADPDLAGLIAERAVPVVLMHNRSTPRHVAQNAIVGAYYDDVTYTGDDVGRAVYDGLSASLEHAVAAGIKRERIILDPGIGFGKTPAQNLELLNRIHELRALRAPVLVGPSRKSFIGVTMDLPPEDRVEGTAAAVAVAITRGADIIRVHDVGFMARVARMTDAIVRRR